MARFIKPKPWTDEWLEYICLEHPVGRAICILLAALCAWAFAALVLCLA